VNYRIENSTEWSRVLRGARSASSEVIAACLDCVERRAVQVLREHEFTMVDVVEVWSRSRQAELLVAEAEANDNLYLDALEALDGQKTPEVMRDFALARALTALANIATMEPLTALMDAAYELSVVSIAENRQLLAAVDSLLNEPRRS